MRLLYFGLGHPKSDYGKDCQYNKDAPVSVFVDECRIISWQEPMSGNITFTDELEFEVSELNFLFEEPETGATKGSQDLSNV